jgi:hypothetical protein
VSGSQPNETIKRLQQLDLYHSLKTDAVAKSSNGPKGERSKVKIY